jgi:hypothetical protein
MSRDFLDIPSDGKHQSVLGSISLNVQSHGEQGRAIGKHLSEGGERIVTSIGMREVQSLRDGESQNKLGGKAAAQRGHAWQNQEGMSIVRHS